MEQVYLTDLPDEIVTKIYDSGILDEYNGQGDGDEFYHKAEARYAADALNKLNIPGLYVDWVEYELVNEDYPNYQLVFDYNEQLTEDTSQDIESSVDRIHEWLSEHPMQATDDAISEEEFTDTIAENVFGKDADNLTNEEAYAINHVYNDIIDELKYTPSKSININQTRFKAGKFTRKELEKLRSEIILDSLYTDDYTNSFNIDEELLQDFFDGYSNYLNELKEDPEGANPTDDFDNIDNLENWYLMTDYDISAGGDLNEDFDDEDGDTEDMYDDELADRFIEDLIMVYSLEDLNKLENEIEDAYENGVLDPNYYGGLVEDIYTKNEMFEVSAALYDELKAKIDAATTNAELKKIKRRVEKLFGNEIFEFNADEDEVLMQDAYDKLIELINNKNLKESVNLDIDNESHEEVPPVYADAVRDMKEFDKKKEETTKITEDPVEEPKDIKMALGAKQMHLDESLFVEAYNDGWDKVSELDSYEDVKDDCQRLIYEIDNTVKGAYTHANTYSELGRYIKNVAEELDYFGDEVMNLSEDGDSEDLDESLIKDDDWAKILAVLDDKE